MKQLEKEFLIQKVTSEIKSYLKEGKQGVIPVGVSSRHIHLSSNDVRTLFGENYELEKLKYLSQPGQFAAKETVTVIGMKNSISKVRVLGPVRKESQLEISQTDAFSLGIKPPLRESGDLDKSASVFIIGPKGALYLDEKVIIAKRHIHMTPEDAMEFSVRDGESVSVTTLEERALTFNDVTVRVSPNYALELHLDTDEANASGLRQGDSVFLN